MKDAANRFRIRTDAWDSAVRISAGILIRDYGDGARDQAEFLIVQAQLGENEQSVTFWRAVRDEIDNGDHRLNQ